MARRLMLGLMAAVVAARPSLEDLAFLYGTDKGHDDHKYTDLYNALFEPIRDRVVNITEIGVALGQSLQVWHDYFEKANVYGVDIHPLVIKRARRMFADKPRVHILHANSKSNAVMNLGLAPLSMDIIIDDGDHCACSRCARPLACPWADGATGLHGACDAAERLRSGAVLRS